jgi:serine phosphatase RsbU (regulator of sigma subunit)
MAMSKALTSAALSRMQADPAVMAATINTELLKDNSEAMGVTMVIGVLDLASGAIQLACAGHEDPFLLAADGEAKRIRLDGGPPLCAADFPFPLEKVTLAPGEMLVLVTDGVTEAQDARGKLFGSQRIFADGVARSATSTAIIEAIRDRVRQFEDGEDATDDLTVMAVRYLGPN